MIRIGCTLILILLLVPLGFSGGRTGAASVSVNIGEEGLVARQGSDLVVLIRLSPGTSASLWLDEFCADPLDQAMIFAGSGTYTVPLKLVQGHGQGFACLRSSDEIVTFALPLSIRK